MSWLSDLAGKAESLLEKVDQSAANALQLEKGVGSEIIKDTPSNVQQTDASTRSLSSTNLNEQSLSKKSLPSRPSSIMKDKNDDQLFEFLNSGSDKKRIANQLRSSSPVQTSSPKMPKLNNEEQHEQNKKSSGYIVEKEKLYQSDDSVDVIDASTDIVTNIPSQDNKPARVSNLELENKLLRKEVNSLNEELLSLAQRSKESQERSHSSERELEKLNRQLNQDENFLREFQSREDDLSEAIRAKDTQLAVLRVRMQESDQQFKHTKEKLERFQNENERILKDHTDSSGVQNQVVDDLRTRLQETELSLKHAQEVYERTGSEGAQRQTKLETEQRSMAETIKSLQKNIVEVKRNANECSGKLRIAENKVSIGSQEIRDYKEKAGRILQAKEKVISSLKEGKAIVGDSSGITCAEYEAVCQERDVIRDELHQTKYAVEQLKVDVQELELHVESESETAQEQHNHFQSLLEEQQRMKDEANHDVLKTREELQTCSDDHYRQKTTLISQIQEREAEIEKFKSQLLAKSYTTTSEAELEKRVRALTENLIQKQTVIEALSTEKTSLVLQLERVEMQYRDIQRSTTSRAPTTVHGFDDSDQGARVHSISSIMPSQITESAKVNNAVNEIDKCSIRLGVFLRRYPIARLMLIVYMILLHLWVFIVLLTYKPEVHTSSPGPMPNLPESPH